MPKNGFLKTVPWLIPGYSKSPDLAGGVVTYAASHSIFLAILSTR